MDANALLRDIVSEMREPDPDNGQPYTRADLRGLIWDWANRIDAYLSQAPAGGAPAPTPRADAGMPDWQRVREEIEAVASLGGRADIDTAMMVIRAALRQHEAAAPPAQKDLGESKKNQQNSGPSVSAEELKSRLLSMLYEARTMYPGCRTPIDAIIGRTEWLIKRTLEASRPPVPLTTEGKRKCTWGVAQGGCQGHPDDCGCNLSSEAHRERITPENTMSVLEEIAAERYRQVFTKGFTPEHDDRHINCSLALAAACYAAGMNYNDLWPWEDAAWKPKGPRHNLIRAAALIVAEIERLDRMDGADE